MTKSITEDFEGVLERNGWLYISFVWPGCPEGYPKRQRIKTRYRAEVKNLALVVSLRQSFVDRIAEGEEITVEEFVTHFPKSKIATDLKKSQEVRRVRFIDALEEYENDIQHNMDAGKRAPKTVRNNIKELRGIRFQPLHKLYLMDMTEDTFRHRLMAWQGHKGHQSPKETRVLANTSINKKRDALVHFMKWCAKKKYISGTPWLVIEHQKTMKSHQKSLVAKRALEANFTFSEQQMAEVYLGLYQHESPDAANAFALLCLTGMREAEVLAIAEGDIEFANPKARTPRRRTHTLLNVVRSLSTRQVLYTPKERAENEERTGKPLRDRSYSVHWFKRTKTEEERELTLDPVSIEILKEQMERHKNRPPETVSITGRTGQYEETVRLLFLQTIHCKPGCVEGCFKHRPGRECKTAPYLGSEALYKAYWRTTRNKLGFESGDIPKLQNTRNTKASVMASNGEPMQKIREQLGHGIDTQTLEKFYARYVEEGVGMDLEEVFRKARKVVKRKKLGMRVVK